jgi:hypothetical protein
MKVELVALDSATVEAQWLRELLMELSLIEKPLPPILLCCDNPTILYKVMSSIENMKSSRHVRQKLKSDEISY